MLERLNQLEINIRELELFKNKYSVEEVKSQLQIQWTLRYGLLESIQIIIDIACHIVSKYNLSNPKSYAECIQVLAKEKYLSKELSEKLEGLSGLRNLLVHEYSFIDVAKLYGLLNNIDDLRHFSKEITEFL